MMEDMMIRRHQIPAFGNWDYCDELPITQYFESAMQAGLVRGHYSGEDVDLFKVPAAPMVPPVYTQHPRKVKKSASRSGEKQHSKEQQRKQGRRVCDVTAQVPTTPRRRTMAPKAVDEDLYKIPPELLHQKPKRKSNWLLLGGLLSGCLGLNCVA